VFAQVFALHRNDCLVAGVVSISALTGRTLQNLNAGSQESEADEQQSEGSLVCLVTGMYGLTILFLLLSSRCNTKDDNQKTE